MKQILFSMKRIRYTLCAVVFALSLLLVGAGRLNEGMQTRSREVEKARQNCQNIALEIAKEIPAEHRTAWTKLASENPELCFKMNHSALRVKSN